MKALWRNNINNVHKELKSNCAIRYNGFILHKSIHKKYTDDNFWKERGYCNVYCCSDNWPHACNFTLCCDADPIFCKCNLHYLGKCPMCRSKVEKLDSLVFIESKCCICIEEVSAQRPIRPCGHAICESCLNKYQK
jgi:hypothetical protein